MRDMNDVAKSMNKITMSLIESMNPMALVYGTVTGVDPLRVTIDQKLELDEDFLILTRSVIDYDLDITPQNWLTDNRAGGSGESAFSSHNHGISGRKTIRVHNALTLGEDVVMLRNNGGQEYVIIDRAV